MRDAGNQLRKSATARACACCLLSVTAGVASGCAAILQCGGGGGAKSCAKNYFYEADDKCDGGDAYTPFHESSNHAARNQICKTGKAPSDNGNCPCSREDAWQRMRCSCFVCNMPCDWGCNPCPRGTQGPGGKVDYRSCIALPNYLYNR